VPWHKLYTTMELVPVLLVPTCATKWVYKAVKVSTSMRGVFHVLLHKPCHVQVHSARSSCTALHGFENSLNLAKNRK